MHHFDNLIVGLAMAVMLSLFMRSVLNSLSPGLGDAVLKGMKKLAVLLGRIVVWIFQKLLSLLGVDLKQKKLPGRRR